MGSRVNSFIECLTHPLTRVVATSSLLIHAAGEEAAVNNQYLTGDEAGRVGRQKDRGPGQLFDFAETLHRRSQQKFPAAVSFIQKFLIQRRAKYSGRNRVYIYS